MYITRYRDDVLYGTNTQNFRPSLIFSFELFGIDFAIRWYGVIVGLGVVAYMALM